MSSATDPQATINEIIDSIYPAFILSVANAAFCASLFTLFVALLALSTKESRRRLVFRLNVFAICIVLSMGVLVGFGDGEITVNQADPLPAGGPIASAALTVFPPLLFDSILLTRLFALYPLSSTRPATLLKIYTFPFCVKCARVAVLTRFLNEYATYVRSATAEDPNPWFHNPNLIAEWTMQIADNMYSVILFLYNLHARTDLIKRGGMPARIRQIFYVSVANFVFPLLFNIILIIYIMTNQSFVGGLLIMINNYVTVMGVLCATVWFSRMEWVRSRNDPLSDDMFGLEPSFRMIHDASRKRESKVVLGKVSSTPDTADLDAGPVRDGERPATLTGKDEYCIV
ncbi:hypothetical protein EDC04DRAFT_2903712 [Pisolithus marmoratus]|nr:hypothetical protein EDC04DRAFT_2903712 [Pisolithus marmoratus]